MKAHIKIDKMFWFHVLGSVLCKTVFNTKLDEMTYQKTLSPSCEYLSTCNTS
jgi:hypothetical protein